MSFMDGLEGIKREVEKVPHKTGRRKALKPEEIVQTAGKEEEVEASNVEETRGDAAEAANTTPNKFFSIDRLGFKL